MHLYEYDWGFFWYYMISYVSISNSGSQIGLNHVYKT